MQYRKIVILVASLFFTMNIASAQIPSPEKILGFEIGTDRKVADMHQIVDYFKRLDKASNRISVIEIGKTTMENPFIVAFITSQQNHTKLETYRKYQQLLADPRKIDDKEAERMIADGKTIVMINCSIHASEIGASQMSMQLAYDLAVKNDRTIKNILDNVILLLIPMHNPDGIQMVVDWYNKNLDTKYEGGRMPWLYHKYVGHDNNRDWYMFTQVESRLTIKVHNDWHPQIVLDMHQMGSRGARLFVPPYVDPYEPNVDPILTQQVATMGTFIASELTAQGKGGVVHSQGFDAWTPARAYHHYHGGVRILTEAASVSLATPITVEFDKLSNGAKKPSVSMPLVWKGGEWTLKDIVDYDYAAAMAALIHAAGLRENWLRSFYAIHKKAVARSEAPYAFIIPQQQKDYASAVKMMNILRIGGVEIHRADASFVADGSSYPEGSYIIFTAQPYGGYAKALLEDQEYPEIRETPDGPLKTPYDVVAHTLPRLMGVKSIQVEKPFNADTKKLTSIEKLRGKVKIKDNVFGYAWSHTTNDDIIALNRLLKKNYAVSWAAETFQDDGKKYPAGTMIIKEGHGVTQDLKSITQDQWVQFDALESEPRIKVYQIRPVRLGLYKSWAASIDEGWTRWVLEQYEFSYQNVLDQQIREGNLGGSFDVLIIPDLTENAIVKGLSENDVPPEYAGGIGKDGVQNIRQFIEEGGTLITLNSAAEFPIKQFSLTVDNRVADLDRRTFFIPGSILKVIVDNSHPIAYGYDKKAEIFFRRSPVFSSREGKSVLKYPAYNPLLSGWINGETFLFNQSAIVDVPFGKGKIILIGFPAQYRGQSHGTFRFLFNAIFYGPAELGDL